MKPMLAHTIEDMSKIVFPVLASPKLDGIRCLIVNGEPLSRNFKRIPNLRIWHALYDLALPGLDGELIVGEPRGEGVFNRSTSGVMSREGSPNFTFWVFDRHDMLEHSFAARLERAKLDVKNIDYKSKPRPGPFIKHVPHKLITSLEELEAYEATQLLAGYEGVMLRDPAGPYKHGRSTMREGYLGKVKRFCDGEARVVGVVERQHNANEQTRDELGRAKRSSHKANKVPTGTMGALQVIDLKTKVEFEIGTGFDDAQRAAIWAKRDSIAVRGAVVKYKYQPVGVKDKPRFPVFLGFRDKIDL